MPDESKRWILIVDEGGGRLLEGAPAPQGRCRLEVVDTLANPWEEHQHGRPSPLKYKDAHTHAAQPHEAETMRHRFAKDVAEWLDDKASKLGIERVALFAPPRLLGELRRTIPKRLAGLVDEHEGDLGYMETAELIRQPAIARLIGAKQPT